MLFGHYLLPHCTFFQKVFSLKNTSRKLNVNEEGLKRILETNNLSYDSLIKRFETDLRWNFMIFQIYKNKITLNSTEIEDKLQLRLQTTAGLDDQTKIDSIKEQIVNEEKE